MSVAAKAKWRFWRPSIALRLTVWYAFSALAMILLATGYLYWVLVTNLDREDGRVLTDNLNNIRFLIHSVPSGALRLEAEEAATWPQPPAPQIYFRVFDQDARLLVETPGMSEELPTPSVTDLTALSATEGLSCEVVSRSGKVFQTLTARVDENRVSPARFIEVGIDRANEEHVLDQYRERLWLVLSLSVFVCALVGYLIARTGMRPIESIGRTAEQIRLATLHERIAIAGLPAELSGLAATFNSMLDRLEDSFTRISQFSDDVAHELRTPISNLRGELEVALSKARPVEYYRDILESSLEECGRISRVIQSLLFLARAENATDWLPRDEVDVGRELKAIQEFYDAAAAEAGVQLRVSVEPALKASLDRTLFQQAVSNLVSNAIGHTPEGGLVEIAACVDTGLLKVSVVDTGRGIPAEHLPRVLDRFYRVDRARAGSIQNVGLGLSVVKSIVDRHGGHIEIDSKVGCGTKVEMTFLIS